MNHFLDIGSNVGQTFDWLKTQSFSFTNRVFWAFEPSPRHFCKLLEKCKKESLNYNIRLCPFGIGAETGIIELYEKDDPKGDSFYKNLSSNKKTININNGYFIFAFVKSLPSFLMEFTEENDEIIINMDCEGSEYDILESLLTFPNLIKKITDLIVEFHFTDSYLSCIDRKNYLISSFNNYGLSIIERGYVK